MLSPFTAALAALSPAGHPAAMQQEPPPDDYFPFLAAPALTAQASSPITVTVKTFTSPRPNPPVSPDPFPFTITGKDMDTWKNSLTNAQLQVSDPVICDVVSEEYASERGPVLRGTSTDNVATWDLIVFGLAVLDQSATGELIPAKVYVNTYVVHNTPNRNSTYQDDPPVVVHQSITRPAFYGPGKSD